MTKQEAIADAQLLANSEGIVVNVLRRGNRYAVSRIALVGRCVGSRVVFGWTIAEIISPEKVAV
jgi:dienelactone hydrolase